MRAVFFVLGSDGTVGANKNSTHRSSARRPPKPTPSGYFVYDSKKSGGGHDRPPALSGPRPIRGPYLVQKANFRGPATSSSSSSSTTCWTRRRRARVFTAQPIYGPRGRSGPGLCRAACRRPFLSKGLKFYDDPTPTASARGPGMGGRIQTPSRRPASLRDPPGSCPREDAIAQIKKKRSEKDLRAQGPEVVAQETSSVGPDPGPPWRRSRCRRRAIPSWRWRRWSRPPPRLRPAGDRGHAEEQRRAGCRSACSGPDGRLGKSAIQPSVEKRNIAQESPIWTPRSASSATMRAGLPPCGHHAQLLTRRASLDGAPEGLPLDRVQGAGIFPNRRSTIQVAPEDCPGMFALRGRLPGEESGPNPARRTINNAAPGAGVARERAGPITTSSSYCRIPTGARSRRTSSSHQFKQPALRILRGPARAGGETPFTFKLLPRSAANRPLMARRPTGCSSIYGGNLADHSVCLRRTGASRPGPTRSSRTNASSGSAYASRWRSRAPSARQLLDRLRAPSAAKLVYALAAADQSRRGDTASPQSEGWSGLRRLSRENPRPRPCGCSTWPTPWSKSRSGSWAATAGPTNIGFGGLGPRPELPGGTSTSWSSETECKIRKKKTTRRPPPAKKPEQVHPIGAIAKVRRGGKRAMGPKDLGLIAMNLSGKRLLAKVAMGARDSQTVRPSNESHAPPGALADHRLQPRASRTVTNMASRASTKQKAGGRDGALAALTATTRRSGRASTRSSSNSTRAPRRPLYHYNTDQRGRFRMLKLKDPGNGPRSWPARRRPYGGTLRALRAPASTPTFRQP